MNSFYLNYDEFVFFFWIDIKQFLPFRNYATVSTRSEYEKVQNKARVIELLTFRAISASGILAISRWVFVLRCGKVLHIKHTPF